MSYVFLTHEQWERVKSVVPPLTATKMLKDEMIIDFIPLLNVPDDGSNINIKYSPFFQEWVPKVWTANENCRYNDYPYQCISGHDSTPNPAWNPKDTPALFRPYHATVAEHALPWRAPAGAHNMYKKGEYMVYEDELTYKALMDTTYTPIEYPQAWRQHDNRKTIS